jgi:hypothetical protein
MSKREIFLDISCDFSVSAVNLMLDRSKDFGLGAALRVEYNSEDHGWSMIFEEGKITSKGF